MGCWTRDSALVLNLGHAVTAVLTLSVVLSDAPVHASQPTTLAVTASLLSSTLLHQSRAQPYPFSPTPAPPPIICEFDDVRRRRENVIRIGVILPMYDTDYAFSLMYTRPAFEIAKEHIHSRRDLLPHHTIELDYRDSNCSDVYGPLEGIEMYARREADVFIGPFCDYAVAPLARFTSYWNIPIITAGGLVQALNDKTMYNLLTRMVGTYSKLAECFVAILRHFEWLNVGMILHQWKDPNKVTSNQWFTVEATFLLIRAQWNDKISMEYAKTFDMYDYTPAELEGHLRYMSRLCRGERSRGHILSLG